MNERVRGPRLYVLAIDLPSSMTLSPFFGQVRGILKVD